MAKKVNKRFIKILAGSAIGLVLAGGGAYAYVFFTHNSDYYIRKANVALQQGKLLEARDYFGRAVNKEPSNTETYMKLADVDERLVTQDPTFLQQAHQVWTAAVQVDPSYKPALNKLLDYSLEQVHGGATQPEVFSDLRRNAELAAKGDPEDVRALVYSHAATVQQWLNGAAFTSKTIDDQTAALAGILKRHPDSADAAYYISEVQLRRAKDLTQSGPDNVPKATALYDQVAGDVEKWVKDEPKNGPMQLRSYQVLVDLLTQDRRSDHVQRYLADAGQAIHAAEADFKPTDPQFDDSRYFYALYMRSQAKNRAEVEKAYRDWVAARPLAAQPRLELASFLAEDAKTRLEAIKILESPLPADPNAKGMAALRMRGYQRSALMALDNLRADDARTMVKPEQRAGRDDLLKQIDADLVKIVGYGFSEDYQYLRLRGKVEMLHGKPIDAIKTFERARTMSGGKFDADLWTRLSDAYLRTGQTGSATRLLEQVVERLPAYVPARIELAELYISRQQPQQADAQIRVLEKMVTTYPALSGEVGRLRVALLTSQKQDVQAKEELSKLPEATRTQRLIKGELSVEAGNTPEAQRLFSLILKDDPADPAGVGELVNLHLREGHRDLALQVVADALKAKPNDPALLRVRDGLNATTPEAVRKFQDQVADQIVDPFARAIRKASLALDRREFDAATRQLDAADKIKPDDPRAYDLRYESLRLQGRLADAADMVDRAAKAGIDGRKGYYIRAKYALDRNDVQGALANARALVGGYGEFAASYLMLGRAQQAAAQYVDAIRSYNAALDRQPGNIEAMRDKANCLDLLGRFDEELSVINAAKRLAPDNPMVRDLGLNFELYHGDPSKVVDTCEALLQKEPENPTYALALGQACTMVVQGETKIDRATAQNYVARANEVLGSAMKRFAGRPEVEQFYAPRAQAMQLAGDLPGAEKLLLEFVALPDQKDKPQGYAQLARLYERANRRDLAEQQWRTAYAKSGKSVEYEIDLARFLANSGRIDGALKLLDDNADQPRILSQRIDVLLVANRLDEAKALVDQALARNDADVNARFQRGIIELRKNDAASAQRDLSLLRDKDPQNPNARLWLSRADRAAGDVADAMTELEAALQIAPTRSDIRRELLDAYSYGDNPRWDAFDRTIADAEADPRMSKDPQWTQIHARGLAKRGLYDQALAEIEAARKLDPDSYALRQDYTNVLLEAKHYKDVLVETDKMLIEGHKEGLIFEQRGVAKAALGDKPGAVQEFDAAIEIALQKKNAGGVSALLTTMRQFIGLDEALARLDKCPPGAVHDLLAIKLYLSKPDYAAAARAADALLAEPNLSVLQRKIGWQTRSEACYALKQYDQSRQAFDQLLKIEPDNWLVLNNVAYLVAEDLNQPQEARHYSGRAYELVQRSGGNPTVADTHGWVLTLCKGQDAIEGLRILQTLADSPDVFPKARYHLAEAYLWQHQPDNALKQLTLAREQIAQMQQQHKEVDADLITNIQKTMNEIQKTKSQTSSR